MDSRDDAWAVIQQVAAEIREAPETIREPERNEAGERIEEEVG